MNNESRWLVAGSTQITPRRLSHADGCDTRKEYWFKQGFAARGTLPRAADRPDVVRLLGQRFNSVNKKMAQGDVPRDARR